MNTCKHTVVPAPREVKHGSGVFHFGKNATYHISQEVGALSMVPGPELQDRGSALNVLQPDNLATVSQVVDRWVQEIGTLVGASFTSVEEGASLSFVLASESMSFEEYQLEVAEKGVTITASHGVGFYYGVQTLLQMMSKEREVSCCTIEDGPRFFWRGLHLDCGRHFQPVDGIKRFIDTMALHKLNILHWHLTEDQGWRLEIEKYPKLTEIGSKRKSTIWGHLASKHTVESGVPHEGYYRKSEVREVVAYARERGVMVMPEIDLPGHSRAAIAAYPELGVLDKKLDVRTKWGVSKHICNPEDSTIAFLQDVLLEVIDLFPSPWIHIGGDEAPKDQWKKSARVQELIKERGLKDCHEMQSWFISQLCTFLRDNGRKSVGWDEIMEGGTPEGAIVMGWRHEKKGVEAAKKGIPTLMTPCQWTYLDYRETNSRFEPLTITGGYRLFAYSGLEKMYKWNPLPKALTDDEKKLIMGGQGQVWTEYMPTIEVVEYMTWPRASALAERLWSTEGTQDFADFSCRLEGSLALLNKKGITYHFRTPLSSSTTIPCTNGEQSVTIPLSALKGLPDSFERIQFFFKRKGRKGYGKISSVVLETSSSKVEDVHEGYVGRFNYCNVYTLGDGQNRIGKDGKLVVTLEPCGKVPFDNTPGEPCNVEFTWIVSQ